MITLRELAGTFAGAGVGLALGGPLGALALGGATLLYSLWPRGKFGPAMVKAALSMEGAAQGSATVRTLVAPYDPDTTNWCGLAVQGWIRMASAATGLHPSVTGSPQAKAIIQQFKGAKDGHWYDVTELRKNPSLVEPGMVVVWTRGDPSSWTGHIGLVIAKKDAQTFVTMEGNNLPKIARFDHPLSSDVLLGMGKFEI